MASVDFGTRPCPNKRCEVNKRSLLVKILRFIDLLPPGFSMKKDDGCLSTTTCELQHARAQKKSAILAFLMWDPVLAAKN